MRLPRPWIPLDVPIDAGRVLAELGSGVAPLAPADGVGGDMIRARSLLARGGGDVASPTLSAWLARLGGPWSNVSLFRYAPGAHTPACVDASRDGRLHSRIVLPLAGEMSVHVDGQRVPLRAGRGVVVDTWRRHRIANMGPEAGWIAVADLAGVPEPQPAGAPVAGRGLRVERDADTAVDPWELEAALGLVLSDAPEAARDARIRAPLAALVRIARAAWAEGAPGTSLQATVSRMRGELVAADAARLRLRNGLGFMDALERQALAPLRDPAASRVPAVGTADPAFDRPIFIVSPPRAGSTLLFETLARARGAVTIGDESHSLIEGIPALSPAAHGFESNRLSAADATPAVALALRNRFLDQLHDRDGHRIDGIRRIRMIEKTPKNALRIPFLRAVFPEARFLYLHRDPRQVIASMIESWRSGRFVTYPQLPGWRGPPWSLLLVPGWEELNGQPLDAIVGAQWEATVRTLLDDLDDVPRDRRLGIDYADLLADPAGQLHRVCEWAALDWDRPLDASLPLSRYTVSAPDADKWRRHEADVERQLEGRGDLVARAAAAAR